MKRIDIITLRELSARAAGSPRLRVNLNLHETPSDPVQRLLNAFVPGTYVRPHRHIHPPRWELFVHLAGTAALLTFEDNGQVRERLSIGGAEGVRVVEIPAGIWHTLVALDRDTLLFEIKQGPYTPAGGAELAPWAPVEGELRAADFERWFRTAAPGDTPPF